MIDPIFKPKLPMLNLHTNGIRQTLLIATHIVKTIANMINSTSTGLIFFIIYLHHLQDMISLMIITHSTISEMRPQSRTVAKTCPKNGPKCSMHVLLKNGIRQIFMIVKHTMKMIAPMRNITFSNLIFMKDLLLNTNLNILVYLLLEEIYCMISLIAITHTTISEMRIYPTTTVMIDPIFKPKWSIDTSHITGIRYRLMIVKHTMKMIAPMRIITFSNLFFMKDLLIIQKLRGPEGPLSIMC